MRKLTLGDNSPGVVFVCEAQLWNTRDELSGFWDSVSQSDSYNR